MTILVQRYAPLTGSPAEVLWREGEASYVEVGLARHAAVTAPPPDVIGWCAVVDGELAGLQACRLLPELGEAHGPLSRVRPAYRRQKLCDITWDLTVDLLKQRGVTRLVYTVLASATAMKAACDKRGDRLVSHRYLREL